MAFVNEYIPKEDWVKYNFDELNIQNNLKTMIGGEAARDWTIDRDADIWFRHFYTQSDHTEPDGGYTGVKGYDFYWKGVLMLVKVKGIASGGGHGSPRWLHAKLLSINIPSNLEVQRLQIIKDLEAAFTVYAGAGVFASPSDRLGYTFKLEV